MEKKMLKLIFAGLVTAAVLAAALILLQGKKVSRETGVKVFADHDPTQIQELQVTNASGSYKVLYDEAEEGYVFDDLPVNIVDVDGFFELMNHAGGFGSLRLVEADAKDLSLYGLTEPRAQVSVIYDDGSSYSMAIGDEEKISGNYYGEVLSEEEKGNVYLFAKEDMLYFLLRKEAYISDLVTPELAVSSPLSAVRDITFSGTALSQPITITAVQGADPETVLAAKSFGPATHLVRMKGVYELDQTYGIKVLGSVLGIRALEVVGYNVTEEELSTLGFDDPYMQVDFSLRNGTDYITDHQLRLVPRGENYLAYMLGSGVVFLVAPPEFVSVDPTQLCLRWFLSPLRTDLTDLTVEFDGETYVYTTGTDEEGNITAQVNDKPMDAEQFFKLYRLVTGASSDGVYLEDPVCEGEPVLTVTYHYAVDGKSPDVMKLYPGSLRRLNVEINGVAEYDMREAFAQAVKTACRHTLTGEEVEENW